MNKLGILERYTQHSAAKLMVMSIQVPPSFVKCHLLVVKPDLSEVFDLSDVPRNDELQGLMHLLTEYKLNTPVDPTGFVK